MKYLSFTEDSPNFVLNVIFSSGSSSSLKLIYMINILKRIMHSYKYKQSSNIQQKVHKEYFRIQMNGRLTNIPNIHMLCRQHIQKISITLVVKLQLPLNLPLLFLCIVFQLLPIKIDLFNILHFT